MTTLSRPPADPSARRPKGMAALKIWLLFGLQDSKGIHQGPGAVSDSHLKKHPWWKVMCLTGVDYFSTLGYQPGIAALAAGAPLPDRHPDPGPAHAAGRAARLPPGARRARAARAPSPCWSGCSPGGGKMFVLVLLGLRGDGLHRHDYPLRGRRHRPRPREPVCSPLSGGHQVAVTLFLIAILGAVFLKGFKEAIGIAVGLVAVYLTLNFVRDRGLLPGFLAIRLSSSIGGMRSFVQHGSPVMMVAVALLVFPRLALGLSGFETGVAVMPPVGRIPATPRRTRPDAFATPGAPDDRRADHERVSDHQQLRHRRCSSRTRSSRKAGSRAGSGLSGARVPR